MRNFQRNIWRHIFIITKLMTEQIPNRMRFIHDKWVNSNRTILEALARTITNWQDSRFAALRGAVWNTSCFKQASTKTVIHAVVGRTFESTTRQCQPKFSSHSPPMFADLISHPLLDSWCRNRSSQYNTGGSNGADIPLSIDARILRSFQSQ